MPLDIDVDAYELVTFKNNESAKRQRGYLIGERLVVSFSPFSDGWKVYRMSDGRPLVKWRFYDSNDAIKFAEWFIEKYSEYLPVWDEHPNADLFQICAWSVKNGLDILKIIRDAKKEKLADLCQF